MNNDEKAKMLRLMRFWLFGTFILIFTAATLYTGVATQTGLAILTQPNYWYAMVITLLLCVGAYYLYRKYLDRG